MDTIKLVINSTIFNILFFLETIFFASLSAIGILFPAKYAIKVARLWSRTTIILLKHICKIECKVIGRENIPQNQFVIFASKHQSALETIVYQDFFTPTVFLFKKEILYIPIFGLAVFKTGSIPINRKNGNKKMITDLQHKFKERLKTANIVMFPEGTRTKPHTPANYKSGISLITEKLNTYIVPIAINSGLFWKKRGYIKHPGTVIISLLPPIKTGNIPHTQIQQKIVESIETELNRIYDQNS